VLILTNSAASPDIQRSYSLHASPYVAKPADFDGFTDAIRQIARWFLELIELPRPS
jgi:two-component system response regulator